MEPNTIALVGATGGAGTTRTAVELAAIGARDGYAVAVLDADFAIQGLSEYVDGRIGVDLTALLTDRTDAPLRSATSPMGRVDDGTAKEAIPDESGSGHNPGRVDLVPTRAPFERVASAKTAAAARELERRIAEAERGYDVVIVDTPPVASNEAVGVVTTVDRVVGVRPASQHGVDSLQRLRGRLVDVGATMDGTIAVRTPTASGDTAEPAAEADVTLPPTDPAIADAPTAVHVDDEYGEALASVYGELLGRPLTVSNEDGGLLSRFG